MARGIQGTGNRYLDLTIALIFGTIALLAASPAISQLCMMNMHTVANDPQALNSVKTVCGNYWDYMSNFFTNMLTKI